MAVPEYPQSRVEQYLAAILEAGGGGGGGGGGGFKVTIALVTDSTATSDKTSTEILNAAIGGSVPYAILTIGGNVQGVLPLLGVMHGEAMFGYEVVDSSSVTQIAVTVDNNGDATLEQNVFEGGGGGEET